MSYEYRNKRIIENFARRYTTNVSDEVDILFELEHVYSQAAKADEYEAKAKAFDEIIHAINSSSNPGQNVSPYIDAIDFTIKAEYIVRKYESGESDA